MQLVYLTVRRSGTHYAGHTDLCIDCSLQLQQPFWLQYPMPQHTATAVLLHAQYSSSTSASILKPVRAFQSAKHLPQYPHCAVCEMHSWRADRSASLPPPLQLQREGPSQQFFEHVLWWSICEASIPRLWPSAHPIPCSQLSERKKARQKDCAGPGKAH